MSNILIIKHGSLGDIAQISGAIQDIKENHQQDKVFLLTTSSYENLFNKCPYIDKVYVDQISYVLNLIIFPNHNFLHIHVLIIYHFYIIMDSYSTYVLYYK